MSSLTIPYIAVGVDGSDCGRAAAEWAAVEAGRRKVGLRVLNAYTPPLDLYPAAGGMAAFDLLGAAREWSQQVLRDALDELERAHPDLAVHATQHEGHPVQVLRDASAEAALTVVGAHGAHQFSQALIGSVASRVAMHALSPVVVVRSDPSTAADSSARPVVVGVDGSPDAQTALGFAFDEAALRRVGLIAVHSWDEGPVGRVAAGILGDFDAREIDAEERRVLSEQLAGWADKYPGVSVEHHVVRGNPAATLLRIAAASAVGRQAQLLVVGSRGRGGFVGKLLGSTSAALIAHAPCPVAVVRDFAGS